MAKQLKGTCPVCGGKLNLRTREYRMTWYDIDPKTGKGEVVSIDSDDYFEMVACAKGCDLSGREWDFSSGVLVWLD